MSIVWCLLADFGTSLWCPRKHNEELDESKYYKKLFEPPRFEEKANIVSLCKLEEFQNCIHLDCTQSVFCLE